MDWRSWARDPELLLKIGLVGLGVVIGVIVGYGIGSLYTRSFDNSVAASISPVEEKGTSYQFVHPLLAYHTPEATTLGQYTGLDSTLNSIASSATAGGGASRVSVYFRDLEAGQWVGVNETDTYYPASLLKVPALIAYYKEAETSPAILNETAAYDPGVMPADQPFDATSTLATGALYSVSDLIHDMIVDSDNGATFTLLDRLNPDYLNAVYSALGIPNPGNDSAVYQISTRAYAFFFRVLYNATYLSPDSSEKALKLLSQTTFTQGLVAGVPADTIVAHKYGEHVLTDPTGATAVGVELSDCGIIYYPAHPYLLCVMTSAQDVPTAENIIATVSKATYAAVNSRYVSAPEP